MRTRIRVVTSWLLGALALLPCRAALAQDSDVRTGDFHMDGMTLPMMRASPSFEAGWWGAITDALDALRGLRGRRISAVAKLQVDLRMVVGLRAPLAQWQDVPPVAAKQLYRLTLQVGPLRGAPVRFEPATASIVDLRGESGELLGAGLTLPWILP